MVSVRTSDGIELAVHDLGGQGPPMVFVHATGLHGLVWQPLADELRQSYRCLSFDRRAHGDSRLDVDWDFDWRDFGLDILAVVDGLDLTLPFGVGHSSGATALLLAEQARPGTFGGLYCFEPVLIPADPPLGRDPDNWLAAAARRRREVFPSREQAYENYAAKPPFATWLPSALRAYVDHGLEDAADGTVRLKCRPSHEAVINEMATAHDGFGRLQEVRCPVTIARGSDTDAHGPALTEALPCSRLDVVGGVGHFGPLEDPGAVSASIRHAFTPVPR